MEVIDLIFLLVIELVMHILDFMFSPIAVAFPFEVVSVIYQFINYIADGLSFITYFVFDSWMLRSVFTFIVTLNALLLGFDLVWRIISYIKLSRDG